MSSKTNSNVDNRGTKTSQNSFRTKPKQESLKSNIRGNIEETNTGGCGIDPAYSRGRKGKRSTRGYTYTQLTWRNMSTQLDAKDARW